MEHVVGPTSASGANLSLRLPYQPRYLDLQALSQTDDDPQCRVPLSPLNATYIGPVQVTPKAQVLLR